MITLSIYYSRKDSALSFCLKSRKKLCANILRLVMRLEIKKSLAAIALDRHVITHHTCRHECCMVKSVTLQHGGEHVDTWALANELDTRPAALHANPAIDFASYLTLLYRYITPSEFH